MADSIEGLSTSIQALTQEYETVAQNLANMSTAGYKRTLNSFSRELLSRLSENPDTMPEDGAITAISTRDFTQGQLVKTDRSLDMAIQGKGFFVVETPEGPLYTRNGAFQIQRDGRLVDLNGRNVEGADGPIVIPTTISEQSITVSADGSLRSGTTALGRLRIVDFGAEESRLTAKGFNCFSAPADAVSTPATNAAIHQGYQEASNVRSVEEMVNLMVVSRMYETTMSVLRKRQEYARAIMTVANG
ncbi:MAG: flagellar hook basal-body protein [Phycisphaerae bacterium]|nr:flagellar hook basal-body protein [Phycisphaerae bacterium]